MWIRTTDGDLVNLDLVVRIGRYGGDGNAVLSAMRGDGLQHVGIIDEATWQRVHADWEAAQPHMAQPHTRKKP